MEGKENSRSSTPYSHKVRKAIGKFNRAPYPFAEHHIPESETDIETANRMTEGLVHLFNSSSLSEIASNYLCLAVESMLRAGEISEEQFMAIHNALVTNLPSGL